MSFPKIEGYMVVEKLGSGSYSTVYKAFNKDGKRDCAAIKCIERSIMKGSAVENLITEIRLLKTLNHPHIVKMKDFQWDERYVYIIMEFCNYGDLSKYLKKNVVPEYLCKKLLRQLALALQEMRQRGIVHMDLKPQNLLLHKSVTEDIILKVGDFGFAQYMSDESRMNSLRGSPLYMAPEIFLGCSLGATSTGYDAKVDLWSVGVILFECLFGKAPYSSNSYKLLEEKIRSQQKIEIPAKSKISADCRDLMENLLQHDANDRISYEDFFQHPFLDMKHMPSAENYKKAADLVCSAIEKDSQRDYEGAYHLYCESLRYFVPMVTEENNALKKSELRNKVKRYIKRAEELKLFTISEQDKNSKAKYSQSSANCSQSSAKCSQSSANSSQSTEKCSQGLANCSHGTANCSLHPDGSETIDLTKDSPDKATVSIGRKNLVTFKKNQPEESVVKGREEIAAVSEDVSVESGLLKLHMAAHKEKFEELYALCSSSSSLRSGLEVGMSAEMYVAEGRTEEALRLYRGALATLLRACGAEPPGLRFNLLKNKIDEWLREAESIKALLESKGIQDPTSEEDQQSHSQCSIQ